MLHRITGEQTSFTAADGRIASMSDREPIDQDPGQDLDHDHWAMFAEAMDLTIEGHRLIAQEIGYEARLLWRWTLSWLRDLTGSGARRHPSPPA
jgi:hypothetical protein